MKTKLFLTATLILGTTALLMAQDTRNQGRPSGRPQQGQQGRPSGGPEGGGQGGQGQRPPMPIIEALDVNKNHVIDADEIANASAALKKLDKNGDGKLTADEFMPARPGGQRGSDGQGQGSQRGPSGQGGQGRPPQGQP